MSRIVLALSSDAPYAPHAAAMLLSAVTNTPQARFVIHYLTDPDFPEATREKLRQSFSRFGERAALFFHVVPDEWVVGLPLFKFMRPGEMRPVMWYRLFLPRLLPAEPKALYLDCDTLVLQSLEPLWNLALGEHAIAAITNPSPDRFGEFLARFDLPSHDRYFNSGVMLMNLDRFRRERLDDAVLEHGRANADWTRFGDQDSLVAVLHGQRLPLAPQWNLMHMVVMFPGVARRIFSDEALKIAVREPAIVHFEGVTKPWVSPTVHPWGRFYDTYARQLPWLRKHNPYGLRDAENLFLRKGWMQACQSTRQLRLWMSLVLLRLSAAWQRLWPSRHEGALLDRLYAVTKTLPQVSFVQLGGGKSSAALLQRVADDVRWHGLLVGPAGDGLDRLRETWRSHPQFGFAAGVIAPSLPLQTVLDTHAVQGVDVLIIRPDGYDGSALRIIDLVQMLDMTRNRPKALLYEHRQLPEPEHLLLREVLGMMFTQYSVGGDTLAIRNS